MRVRPGFDQLGNGWNAFADIDIAPRMDVRDAKDVREITVEGPGVSKDDVKIAVDDNVLAEDQAFITGATLSVNGGRYLV